MKSLARKQKSYPQISAVGDELSTEASAEVSGVAVEERPCVGQQRTDGLVLMAETLLDGGVTPANNAERYQVVVHVAARVEEESHAHGPRIDARTCVPKWQGETMDYAMGVDGLLARAARLGNRPHPGDP